MKHCQKHGQLCTCTIAKKLTNMIGDEVVGFFERSYATSLQEVRVFTPVYRNTKSRGLVN